MELIYFKGSRWGGRLHPNFGDELNAWMWEELLPGVWDAGDEISFSGIGTIIDRKMLAHVRRCIVLGSGVGYGSVPEGFGNSDWRVLSVRGPLSAQVLELAPELALTDGAIALAQIDRLKKSPDRGGVVVFMPHSNTARAGHWEEACRAAGIQYLSPEVDSRLAVETIRSARLVLADAMHAAIVADTFRVPWVPVTASTHNNTFKWLDWTLSLGLQYVPVILPPTSSLEVSRTYTLPLCAERFRVTPPTRDAAIRDFAQKKRLRSSRYWKSYSDVAGKALISLPQLVYNSKAFAPLRLTDRSFYVDTAAKALQAASRGTQYLSDEKMFGLRSEQMMEKLHTIPGLLENWSGRA